jgi:hypothetical protein
MPTAACGSHPISKCFERPIHRRETAFCCLRSPIGAVERCWAGSTGATRSGNDPTTDSDFGDGLLYNKFESSRNLVSRIKHEESRHRVDLVRARIVVNRGYPVGLPGANLVAAGIRVNLHRSA